MKKNSIRNLLILIFAALAFSCTNIIENSLDKAVQTEHTAFITLSLGDNFARTVIPVVNATEFSELVLKGTKSGGEEQNLGNWSTVNDMEAAAIAVSTGSWTFTLTAKQGNTSLSGTTSKEIKIGENSLSFELKITDFGNETGSFSIKLDFSNAGNAEKVTKTVASLENLDGSAVTGTSPQNLMPSENAVTFSANGIAAGTYRAKVVFYATEGGTDFELATYRELVQVSSSLASNATRTIESFDSLYTITYNLNDGALADGATLQETVTRKSEAITLPILTRNYYTFDGWFTDENFADGTEVTTLENFTDNINVYASFTPVTYTITYELNGGTNADEAVTTYTVEDDVTLLEPEKGEEAFGGFYYANDFSGSLITGWNAGEKNENITLYAKWDGIKVTAENILEKIASMTESGTLKAYGEFSSAFILDIRDALVNLNTANENVLVKLDLSEVTGLDFLEQSAFANCKNLEGILLPETITSINYMAFEGCNSLKCLKIPSGVTYLGQSIFVECNSLEEITIPFVGDSTYSKLFGSIFKSASINASSGNGVTRQYYSDSNYKNFCIPSSLKKVTVTGGKIPYGAFYGCSMIEEIVIENLDDTTIGKKAFSGCTGLKSITLPEGVTVIGDEAFRRCESLISINLPEELTSIGDYSFYACESLTCITLPDSVCSIGKLAFSTDDFYIGNGKLTRHNTFYYHSNLESINLPASLSDIGAGAFAGCSKIDFGEISIPSGVTTVEEYAFCDCIGITGISFPDSVKSIGDFAFAYCTNLTSITLSDSLISIGDDAFDSCSGLTSITLPDSLISIGARAFRYCTGFRNITIPDSVTSIGGGAFAYCTSLADINVPSKIKNIESGTFSGCTALTSIDDLLTNISYIGDSAFRDCTGVTSVTIPSSVNSIGTNAFEGCSNINSIIFKGKYITWHVSDSGYSTTHSSDGNYITIKQNKGDYHSFMIYDDSTAKTYLLETYCSYAWGKSYK